MVPLLSRPSGLPASSLGSNWTSCSPLPPPGRLQAAAAFSASLSSGRKGAGGALGGARTPRLLSRPRQRGSWNVAVRPRPFTLPQSQDETQRFSYGNLRHFLFQLKHFVAVLAGRHATLYT